MSRVHPIDERQTIEKGIKAKSMRPPSPPTSYPMQHINGAPVPPMRNHQRAHSAEMEYTYRNQLLPPGYYYPSPSNGQPPPFTRTRSNSFGGDTEQEPLVNHRRSNSFGTPPTAFQANTPPTRPGPKTSAFSPRNEIINSFGSMSPRSSPRSSPRLSPSNSRPDYSQWPSYQQVSYQQGSPSHPLLNAKSHGGEAIYHTKQDAVRKKHMRQQSAQLFMESYKGKEQIPSCRDVIWLLLFVFHLLGIFYLNNTYGYEALEAAPGERDQVTVYYSSLIYVASMCGAFAVLLSAIMLAIMTSFAQKFVQVALFFIIGLSFVWGTIGVGLSPKSVVPVTGIIALALSIGYAFIVWDRIPFAATNLLAAVTGIKAFPGTMLLAFLFQALTLGTCVGYSVLLFAIYDSVQDGRIPLTAHMARVAYALIAVSFYWTFQVLLNTVQVVTASIIGEWWFQEDENATVKRSSFNTIYYSMGSICFGSLTVGPVRFIRQVSAIFRPSSDEASLLCLHECLHFFKSCIAGCVDGLADRFNAWGFTYVGLYSYGFYEASQRATDLFKMRGWTMIASDDLVPNILLMCSLVMGGMTGCFGYLISELAEVNILSLDQPGPVSFITGFVIGLALTSVLFGVISSAVNTVLVCFASSPVDLAKNHPTISNEMGDAWREVWPGALDAVDLQVALQKDPLVPPPPPAMV